MPGRFSLEEPRQSGTFEPIRARPTESCFGSPFALRRRLALRPDEVPPVRPISQATMLAVMMNKVRDITWAVRRTDSLSRT